VKRPKAVYGGAENSDEPGLNFRDWGIGIREGRSKNIGYVPDPKNDPGQPCFHPAAWAFFLNDTFTLFASKRCCTLLSGQGEVLLQTC
jgi:hypothetical protein